MSDNWRDRLCLPVDFYSKHIPNLGAPDAAGIAMGDCPLCADRGGTLTIHITNPRGSWVCSANCGRGDMIEFAQRLLGADFPTAVRALIEARS